MTSNDAVVLSLLLPVNLFNETLNDISNADITKLDGELLSLLDLLFQFSLLRFKSLKAFKAFTIFIRPSELAQKNLFDRKMLQLREVFPKNFLKCRKPGESIPPGVEPG